MFATCSEYRYSEYFQKSPETVARQGRQAMAQERTREGSTCGTADQRQERLTKRCEKGMAGCAAETDEQKQERQVEKAEGER